MDSFYALSSNGLDYSDEAYVYILHMSSQLFLHKFAAERTWARARNIGGLWIKVRVLIFISFVID